MCVNELPWMFIGNYVKKQKTHTQKHNSNMVIIRNKY